MVLFGTAGEVEQVCARSRDGRRGIWLATRMTGKGKVRRTLGSTGQLFGLLRVDLLVLTGLRGRVSLPLVERGTQLRCALGFHNEEVMVLLGMVGEFEQFAHFSRFSRRGIRRPA